MCIQLLCIDRSESGTLCRMFLGTDSQGTDGMMQVYFSSFSFFQKRNLTYHSLGLWSHLDREATVTSSSHVSQVLQSKSSAMLLSTPPSTKGSRIYDVASVLKIRHLHCMRLNKQEINCVYVLHDRNFQKVCMCHRYVECRYPTPALTR